MKNETWIALQQSPPRPAGAGRRLVRRGLFGSTALLVGLGLFGVAYFPGAPRPLVWFWSSAMIVIGTGVLLWRHRLWRTYTEGRAHAGQVIERSSRPFKSYAYKVFFERQGRPQWVSVNTDYVGPVEVGSEVCVLALEDGRTCVVIDEGLFRAGEVGHGRV